jgi:hypothetical protein
MKKLMIVVLVLWMQSGWAQQTYSGLNGYIFLPSAFPSQSTMGASISGNFSDPENISVLPAQYSVYRSFFKNRLQMAFSNTYWFVDADQGFIANENRIALPLLPAVKFLLQKEVVGVHEWAYSVGGNLSLGAFAVAGWRANWPWIQPEVQGGISLITKFYVYGTMALSLANAKGEALPLSMALETAISASAEVIGETDEGFIALSVQSMLGPHAAIQLSYREDPMLYRLVSTESSRPYPLRPGQNQGGVFNIKMMFFFDGIKSLKAKGE